MKKTARAGVLAVVSGVSFMAMTAPGAYAAGMPQLDFHNPLVTGQVIWGGVIFLGFYLVLSRVMLPRVGRVLEDRSNRISNDLEVARAAKHDADNAVAELQHARKEALAQAQANLKQALDDEQRIADQKMEEINARLGTELADAEKRVAAEKLKAFAALKDIAAETTQSLVSRLTGAPADTALVARKVEGATAQRTV